MLDVEEASNVQGRPPTTEADRRSVTDRMPRRRTFLGLAASTVISGNILGRSMAADHQAPETPDRQSEGVERPSRRDLRRTSALVLGATGFIGTRVVRALEARSVEIAAASRRGEGPHGVALDRRDTDRVRGLVRERRIGTVIDLLAYTEADTLPLLATLDGEVDRWVMASSCDVYRNYEGLHRKAKPAPITTLLTEQSPLRATRYPYRTQPRREPTDSDAYLDDYDKIPLEIALREREGLSGVILRLPMVFGPGDRQRRFRWIIEPMLIGADRLSVDPGWARWRTSYGYVEDVAHAIATATLHPATTNRIFNLGEGDPLDHRGWIDRFAASLDWRGAVVEEAAPAGSLAASLDLDYPLATSTGAFRAICDWHEPIATAEALARTIADEKRHR